MTRFPRGGHRRQVRPGWTRYLWALALGLCGCAGAPPQEAVGPSLELQSLKIVGPDGTPRILLEARHDGTPEILLLDARGDRRILLQVTTSGDAVIELATAVSPANLSLRQSSDGSSHLRVRVPGAGEIAISGNLATEPDVVRGARLSLATESGERLVVGAGPDGGLALSLWDSSKRRRAELSIASTKQPLFAFQDSKGIDRFCVMLNPDDSPALTFAGTGGAIRLGVGGKDESEIGTVQMLNQDKERTIILSDHDSLPYLQLGAKDARCAFMAGRDPDSRMMLGVYLLDIPVMGLRLDPKGRPELELRDSDGKRTWRAPEDE